MKFVNCDKSWLDYIHRYKPDQVGVAIERSKYEKYTARSLKYKRSSVHLADPARLALIFNPVKKNNHEDS